MFKFNNRGCCDCGVKGKSGSKSVEGEAKDAGSKVAASILVTKQWIYNWQGWEFTLIEWSHTFVSRNKKIEKIATKQRFFISLMKFHIRETDDFVCASYDKHKHWGQFGKVFSKIYCNNW